MTHIVQSTYTQDEHEQAGGGRYTTERHIDNLGRPMTFGPYLCMDNMDPQAIMQARATRLDAEFAAREAEANEAAQGRVPWSKLEFRNQLGQQTEAAMDYFFATFESNPALTTEQKAMIRTGWARYREAHYIERPLRAEVLTLLGLFKALGLITQERIDAIVAASELA
jgi:hypothetical protein